MEYLKNLERNLAMLRGEPHPLEKTLKPDSSIIQSLQDDLNNSVLHSETLTLTHPAEDISYESPPGVVGGRLFYSHNGHTMDCASLSMIGSIIPYYIDRVVDIKSDALFILLLDSHETYFRLVEDKFYDRFPCIIVKTRRSGRGQPDVATKLFLRRLKMELKLPVFAFVGTDCPSALKVLSAYGLDVKWLGIRPSDLEKYEIPNNCRMTMTKKDIRILTQLLDEDCVKNNPVRVEELTQMMKSEEKVEIECLAANGIQFVSKVFLPLKLQEKDWI